jgi:fumarate hydratase subunit beta
MNIYELSTPLTDEKIEHLRAGDKTILSGVIYTARDAAHQKIINLLNEGKNLPFNLQDQVIYYVGPSPAKPGRTIGSAGPTTSSRMDPYTPALLAEGLKGMIGKGARSEDVCQAIQKYKAVYFAAIGGAAALMSKCITKVEVIAYPELGPEAIYKLEVTNLPLIVINDIKGNDLYQQGRLPYQKI